MKIKTGVRLTGLQPQMVLAAIIVDGVYQRYGQELVITSGVEGSHSETSRHYAGLAIDCRTRYFDPDDIPTIKAALEEALGDDYLVLFEGNHFHIGFKPKVLVASS